MGLPWGRFWRAGWVGAVHGAGLIPALGELQRNWRSRCCTSCRPHVITISVYLPSTANPTAGTLSGHKPGSCKVQTGQSLPPGPGGQDEQCRTWTPRGPLAVLPRDRLMGGRGSPDQGPHTHVSQGRSTCSVSAVLSRFNMLLFSFQTPVP